MTDASRQELLHTLWLMMLDSSKFITSLAILAGALWFLARPYMVPFLEDNAQQREAIASNTEAVNDLSKALTALVLTLSEDDSSKFIVFGNPVIELDEKEFYTPGNTIRVGYSVRRKVSCETTVVNRWLEVNSGQYYYGVPFQSVKAPVTHEFIFFPISITVPELPPGDYVYAPVLIPQDCGEFDQTVQPPWTPVFHIKEAS